MWIFDNGPMKPHKKKRTSKKRTNGKRHRGLSEEQMFKLDAKGGSDNASIDHERWVKLLSDK